MLIKKAADVRESEVTPKELFLKRREFIAAAGMTAAAVATNGLGVFGDAATRALGAEALAEAAQNPAAQKLANLKSPFSTDEKLNSYRDVTTYNNFYEFGTDKADPGKYAHSLKTRPWSVVVEGQCGKPGSYNIEDIMARRSKGIYRMRCVEAWSMVIPWIGYPMSEFLTRFEPTARAKCIRGFKTLVDTRQMPGQTEPALNWPYTEGLRMDEAMHPDALSALASTARCCRTRTARDSPVVPWKFTTSRASDRSCACASSRTSRSTPGSSRSRRNGFYANVNPTVDHPRWSQVANAAR